MLPCIASRVKTEYDADTSDKKPRLEVRWMKELIPVLESRVEEADHNVIKNRCRNRAASMLQNCQLHSCFVASVHALFR